MSKSQSLRYRHFFLKARPASVIVFWFHLSKHLTAIKELILGTRSLLMTRQYFKMTPSLMGEVLHRVVVLRWASAFWEKMNWFSNFQIASLSIVLSACNISPVFLRVSIFHERFQWWVVAKLSKVWVKLTELIMKALIILNDNNYLMSRSEKNNSTYWKNCT